MQIFISEHKSLKSEWSPTLFKIPSSLLSCPSFLLFQFWESLSWQHALSLMMTDFRALCNWRFLLFPRIFYRFHHKKNCFSNSETPQRPAGESDSISKTLFCNIIPSTILTCKAQNRKSWKWFCNSEFRHNPEHGWNISNCLLGHF